MKEKKSGGRVFALTLGLQERVRAKAADALKESDVGEVFSEAGAYDFDDAAGSALKAILAEKTAEYTVKAMKEARKRRMRFGAAALIIAAEKDRW